MKFYQYLPITTILVVLLSLSVQAFTPTYCWSFDTNSAGEIAEDCAGNGLYNVTTITSDYTAGGKISGGRQYTRANSDNDFTVNGAATLTGNIVSLGCWVKVTTSPGSNNAEHICNGVTGVNNFYCAGQNVPGDLGVFKTRQETGAGVSGPTSPNTNTWIHQIISYSGSIQYMWINGTRYGQNALAFTLDSDIEAYFGGRGAEYMDGILDECFLYDGNITDAEALEVYQRTLSWSGGGGPPAPENVSNMSVGSQNFSNTYETNLTTYYLNVSINNTNVTINHVNASIRINGTYYNATGRQQLSNTLWAFNYSRNQPVIAVNNSNYGIYWNWTATYNNSQVEVRNTTVVNQSVYWSFFLTNISLNPVSAIETDTIVGNWTILALSPFWNFSTTQTTYRGINQTNISIVSNLSNQTLIFQFTNITGLSASGSNQSLTAFTNFSFNYGGESFTRTITGNNTLYTMILTDCTASSPSTTTTNRFDVWDEDFPTTARLPIDYEIGYVVYNKDIGQNRSYSFSNSNRNNWSICIYPTTSSYNTKFTAQYGNSSTKRIYSTLFTNISSTQTNYTLYFINISNPLVTAMTIIVQNLAGIVQPGRRVETYRYYIGEGIYRLIGSDLTNDQGQISSYLRTIDTKYLFNVSLPASNTLEKTFGPNVITTNPLTLILGLTQLPGFNQIIAISRMRGDLTYNNNTRTYTFTWENSGVDTTGFTIDQTCLYVTKKQNNTAGFTAETPLCSMATSGTMTYLVNFTTVQEWLAQGGANMSGNPSLYPITPVVAAQDRQANLGKEILWWDALIIAGLTGWNPVIGIVATVVLFGIQSMMHILTLSVAAITGLAIVAGIVIYILRT